MKIGYFSDLHVEFMKDVLRSDAPRLDWHWVEELFQFYRCWPKNLRKSCGTIFFEEYHQQHRYNAGLESFWKDNITKQHHALVDARSLYFGWKFAIRQDVGF